jgi:hypothetical protein
MAINIHDCCAMVTFFTPGCVKIFYSMGGRLFITLCPNARTRNLSQADMRICYNALLSLIEPG